MFNFLKKDAPIDWSQAPIYNTFSDAIASRNKVMIVSGRIARVSCYAAANYSGLAFLLVNDHTPAIYYPVGGINPTDAISSVNDEIEVRLDLTDINPHSIVRNGVLNVTNLRNRTIEDLSLCLIDSTVFQ